jgi:tRNA threonylcarbamoyladenosine biosynthesis protein TsaB
VALCEGDEVLHEARLGLSEDGSPQHSTALLAEIERAVAAAGGWRGIELMAVGVGPGSFTGVRVGISTARGLGLSVGLPVIGVCSLDALGRALQERGDAEAALAVMDARRGEVFAALYGAGGARLWDPLVAAPDALAERLAQLDAPPPAAGSGALRFRQVLAGAGVEVPAEDDPVHRIAARHICAIATDRDGEEPSGHPAPIYLRPPDAERWRERDTFKAAS